MKRLRLALPLLFVFAIPTVADELPKPAKVDLQPLGAPALRIADALDLLGTPLTDAEKKALTDATKDKTNGVQAIQTILDKRCLAEVEIRSAAKDAKKSVALGVRPGAAKPELAEQGWRVFLVKVHNKAEVSKMELRANSPNAQLMTKRSTSQPDPKVISMGEVSKRFLELAMFNDNRLVKNLSGLELEYRIVQIY